MAFGPRPRTPVQFAQIPRGVRRSITIDITDTDFDSVIQYAVDTNPDGSFADSLREMILAAVTSDLTSTVVQAARRQATNEARVIVREAMADALESARRRVAFLDVVGAGAVNGIVERAD